MIEFVPNIECEGYFLPLGRQSDARELSVVVLISKRLYGLACVPIGFFVMTDLVEDARGLEG